MKDLTKQQRMTLLDLMEAVLDDGPIGDAVFRDPHIIFQFLTLTKDSPDIVYHFVHLISVEQLCQLTRSDVLSEELIIDLHCMFGFNATLLAQWLRGIGYGGFSFFMAQAKERDVMHLDSIALQARTSFHMVDGVFIDSIQMQFPTLRRLLDYVLNQRISFHQYRDILAQMDVPESDVVAEFEAMIETHQVFKPIRSSKQILPFRVFCSFFDFFTDKPEYLTAIAQVFDQLLAKSTVSKTLRLLNDFPYPIIEFMLNRYIKFNVRQVTDHLNDTIRDFEYGAIRKIVRRRQLGLNYRYD